MPTYSRDDDASNEEQRRIRWEDKIGFHLEPQEFMEVVGFPHGGLKNESGDSEGDVYWNYHFGDLYSIWVIFAIPIV